MSGSDGIYSVEFEFTDASGLPSWGNLTKYAVFKNSGVPDYHEGLIIPIENGRAVIPAQILAEQGKLYVGVYGENGYYKMPTIWAPPVVVSAGCAGGDSTITVNGTTYSSADGAVPQNGVVNLLTGDIYSLKGEEGVAGAPGGNQGAGNYGGDITYKGVTNHGGEGCNQVSTPSGYQSAAAGGGGAAVGADGGNAYGDGMSLNSHPGNGATPADADDATTLGSGGQAGHGGGGAGMSMPFYEYVYGIPEGYWEWEFWANSFGTPGPGGKAGDGAPGYVLAYY